MVDSGSVTPPPQSSKEQVQKEPSSEEQQEQIATNEVSKEGQMVEYSQPSSQDTEVQATGSTEIEAIERESSQQETTPRKSDKGKEVVEHTPSSSRARSTEKHISRWFRKEIMRSTKPQFCASKDDICDIEEILNKLESPLYEVVPFSFVTTIRTMIYLHKWLSFLKVQMQKALALRIMK